MPTKSFSGVLWWIGSVSPSVSGIHSEELVFYLKNRIKHQLRLYKSIHLTIGMDPFGAETIKRSWDDGSESLDDVCMPHLNSFLN